VTPTKPADFKFTRDWIHAGVSYKPGDTKAFAQTIAEMLRDMGAGELIKPNKHPAARQSPTAHNPGD
jgi:hypothetical protein